MAGLIAAAAAAAGAYGWWCFADPFPVCPKTVTGRGGRPRPCPRCGGTGHRRRSGATAAHMLAWQFRWALKLARQDLGNVPRAPFATGPEEDD